MSNSPNSPMTPAMERYIRDPSDRAALLEINKESMKKNVEKIKKGIANLEAKPHLTKDDKKKIASGKKAISAKNLKKAKITGGKHTSRKHKSRKSKKSKKSKKGKTAKKRRH